MVSYVQQYMCEIIDTFYTKIPIAPCYCQMMVRTLKEEIRITQYNNPTKAGKYSLEDLFRASDNIPHHYPKFQDDLRFWYFEYCAMKESYPNSTGFSGLSVRKPES